MASEFAKGGWPADEPDAEAAGAEAQPAAEGAETELAGTAPAAEDANAPEKETEAEVETTTEAGELPAEVLAQVEAWENAGGALPQALQGIVDGRIKRELGKVKDLETAKTNAEAEVERLKAELEAKGTAATPPGTGTEAQLTDRINAARKFLREARPFVGGYATEEQKARMEQFMEKQGLNENSLRQYMDEVGDWLTTDAVAEQQRLQQFKQAEQAAQPFFEKRFPSLLKKDSDAAKVATEILRLTPELKQRTPAHQLVVATYILGKLAADHLLAANSEGDVVEQLRSALAKGAPIGTKTANGKPAGLPGKAPAKTPTGSPVPATRTSSTGKQAQLDQQSVKLSENPTPDNVTELLRTALR